MEIRTRRYYKFRHGNRLYTIVQARVLGTTTLSEDGNDLAVRNNRGWSCVMYLQECAYGQKWVEDDAWMKRREKQIARIKRQGET